jgi:RNA polymerase sigma factor (sigma-70 family)
MGMLMSSDDSFRKLMEQVKCGSDGAVERLLELYGDHIYRAVRRRLNQVLRSKFDSQDFVQAVWASFFAHRDDVSRFKTPEELIAFLARIASNKVIDECRHHMQTQKSNVNRERSLGHEGDQAGSLPASEPTPSEVAIANEQFARMTQGQPSRYKKIVELRANGETYEQIAERLGVNEKTVRRVLKKLGSQLEG